MNIEAITKLLSKRTTTYQDVLDCLREFVCDFQQKREDHHICEYMEKVKVGLADKPNKQQLDSATKSIVEHINEDTKVFIKNYVVNTTDEVLDAINDKRIRKKPGYAFLAILASLRTVFEEDVNAIV